MRREIRQRLADELPQVGELVVDHEPLQIRLQLGDDLVPAQHRARADLHGVRSEEEELRRVGPRLDAAPAGSVTWPTLGVIFAQTGIFATSFTQPQTSFTSSGFSPIAMPILRSGRPCGQERFSSNPSTPVSCTRRTISCHASRRYSSMIEAMRTFFG